MGPVLDLAVIALSVLVCLSLGLLAWTLGVTGVRAMREERSRMARLRTRLAERERRLAARVERADAVLRRVSGTVTQALKGDR